MRKEDGGDVNRYVWLHRMHYNDKTEAILMAADSLGYVVIRLQDGLFLTLRWDDVAYYLTVNNDHDTKAPRDKNT
jgi:hypothetical protein